MIHYHGLPITPASAAACVIGAGHAFVSYARPEQLSIAIEVCQSFALDNGAFSAWRRGEPIHDWTSYYEWARDCLRIPNCDWAVIPDVIDGNEADNDVLVSEWPLPRWSGVPVWHMHERLERLEQMVNEWPRVSIGSSAEVKSVGTTAWWIRMSQAMDVVCDAEGVPITKLHGLRMLDPRIFTRLPFSSADSTNIARNIGIDQAWRGSYMPPNKAMRALVMRSRIEAHNSAASWVVREPDEQIAQLQIEWG